MKHIAIQALGELFLTGFSGLTLSQETRSFLEATSLGGVILFSHNFEDPLQLAELSHQLYSLNRESPCWISVDQEGGRVQRFKKQFTRIPSAQQIGATGSPNVAFAIATLLAQELREVGVHLNFAPVVDLQTNPQNSVIGDRSFGSSPDLVSKMACATLQGFLKQGIQPCIKHFPGHGDTLLDSHWALPILEDASLETLLARELIPFIAAIQAHCPMIMIGHLILTHLDPHFPATLSKVILQELLKKRLAYSGLIISDDFEMQAISRHFDPIDAAQLALEAGCDLLVYRSQPAAQIAYEGILKKIEQGDLDPKIIMTAQTRLVQHKEKMGLNLIASHWKQKDHLKKTLAQLHQKQTQEHQINALLNQS